MDRCINRNTDKQTEIDEYVRRYIDNKRTAMWMYILGWLGIESVAYSCEQSSEYSVSVKFQAFTD